MAKVVLICQNLESTSLELAASLNTQNHNVTLVTSMSEKNHTPNDPQNFEILFSFHQWNLVEALQFLPVLWTQKPDIIHIVLSQETISPALAVIAVFAKSLRHCVLSTSLMTLNKRLGRLRPLRYLIQESDIVTCPSVDSLSVLRGLQAPRSQSRGVLPPILIQKNQTAESLQDYFPSLGIDEEFVTLPLEKSGFQPDTLSFELIQLVAHHKYVVLLGSLDEWPLRERKQFYLWMEKHGLGRRWKVSGQISDSMKKSILKHSSLFVLAGLDLSPLELTQYFHLSIKSQTRLVIDSRQSLIYANLWRSGKNCWILNQKNILENLDNFLRFENFGLPNEELKTLEENRQLMDAPLNELNRLYSRALALKGT